MWSLQRTENPKELDRNQPAPQNRAVVQLVRMRYSYPQVQVLLSVQNIGSWCQR